MWKKILIPSLSIALLLVISAPMSSVNAENSRIVNWRIAGTIVQSIEVFNPLDPDISEGFKKAKGRGTVSREAHDLGPGGKVGGPVKYRRGWAVFKS